MENSTHKSKLNQMAAHMDDNEASLALALGLVVQHSAYTEEMLHAIVVHLAEALKHLDQRSPAYKYMPAESGSCYTKKCRTMLGELGDNPHIPPTARAALLHDLDLLDERFERRNRYVHGAWSWDPESQRFVTFKGVRPKKSKEPPNRPEISFTSVDDVYDLASEFARLQGKLTTWDAIFFGEEDEDGARVSVKRW